MPMFICAAFMCLLFGFVIFWQKDLGSKAAHIMLVKLTPGLLSLWICWTAQGERQVHPPFAKMLARSTAALAAWSPWVMLLHLCCLATQGAKARCCF
jgi:hypothetical protein